MTRISSSAKLIFLLLLVVGLMIQSCQKSEDLVNPAQIPSSTTTGQRSDTEWVTTYYLDENMISLSQYASLDTTWYSHDVVQASSNSSETPILALERRVFSSRSKYVSWGNLNGIRVAEMLDYEDRLRFVADSAGISGTTSVPVWFSDYTEDLYEQEFDGPDFQYLGSRFFTNSCNPSSQGCNNTHFFFPAFVLAAPTWGHFNPFAWFLEDNSEAWEPERLSNGGTWSITLRPYPNILFVKLPWQSWRPRATTVKLGQGQRRLFVPFTNSLSGWSNRISSWILFPGS